MKFFDEKTSTTAIIRQNKLNPIDKNMHMDSRCIYCTRFHIVSPQDMSEETSRSIIAQRMQATGVYRHFSTWSAKEQKAAIKDCGLASSKYGNKVKRNEILPHLANNDLPTDPGKVLGTLNSLNICLLGAKNRQQFAYLLLAHMSEGLAKPAT